MTTSPKTFKTAEALAAEQGIILTPNDRRKIAEVQTAERARLQALQGESIAPGWVDWWNGFYPDLLKSILSFGETLLTFSQTILVSFGVPLVLVLLLIVEHQRVVHGIALFEADYNLTSFAAAALVLLNLVLEFQIHHIEHKAGYHEAQGRVWSLRIWARNALYKAGVSEKWLGISDQSWQEQTLSPATRQKKTLRLVTFSILALALVGSMKTVMDKQTGAWNEALVAIVTQSTLSEITIWMGGLLFALTAVLGAQVLSRYVAIRCVEIIAAMHTAQVAAIDPLADLVDEAGYNAVMGIISKTNEAKALKAGGHAIEPASPEIPVPLTPTANEDAQADVIEPDNTALIPTVQARQTRQRRTAALVEAVPIDTEATMHQTSDEAAQPFLSQVTHSTNGNSHNGSH